MGADWTTAVCGSAAPVVSTTALTPADRPDLPNDDTVAPFFAEWWYDSVRIGGNPIACRPAFPMPAFASFVLASKY